MKIEIRPLSSITPYARNPRRNAGAVATVKASLKEYGWQQPIVVDAEGVIIAGHTRYLAALELGWTDVPVHVAEGLTPAQVKAYRIMDNRSHERAEWDMDLLALEMEDLKALDFDLDLTGFSDEDLAGIEADENTGAGPRASLADRFGIPPFSVINAREGWWQARKQAWIAMGIKSELGRGADMSMPPGAQDGGGLLIDQYRRGLTWTSPQISEKGLNYYRNRNATPGGSLMPAMDYRNRQRGDGKGRAIKDNE